MEAMLTREPLVDPAYSVCPPCPCPPKPGTAEVARDAKLREVNQTRLGTKLGEDPVSFRSKKFTTSEWEKYDLAKYCQALQDCENTDELIDRYNQLRAKSYAETQYNQDQSTERLKERGHDLEFWKRELHCEILRNREEIEKAKGLRERLRCILNTLEVLIMMTQENISARLRREGADQVKDELEDKLLKELNLEFNVQDLYSKLFDSVEKTLNALKERKWELEMDWSDKCEALCLDIAAANLTDGSSDRMFRPGVAKFCHPGQHPNLESWAQFSAENLCRSEKERKCSASLRAMAEDVLRDGYADLRRTADEVEKALADNIARLQGSMDKLQDKLDHVLKEITAEEKQIFDTEAVLRDMQNPLKVGQSRLHNRSCRPGGECICDPTEMSLTGEVNKLNQVMDNLRAMLTDARENLKRLQDSRMMLQKEIANKKNSIFIDKFKVLTTRARYPTKEQLLGHQC